LTRKSGRKSGAARRGRVVPATEFKAHCLELLDRVRQSREEITVTKHGRPVAKLVPLPEKSRPLFGCLAGAVTRYGDLVAPIDERWSADA
jgi:prevent-host-death family protein